MNVLVSPETATRAEPTWPPCSSMGVKPRRACSAALKAGPWKRRASTKMWEWGVVPVMGNGQAFHLLQGLPALRHAFTSLWCSTMWMWSYCYCGPDYDVKLECHVHIGKPFWKCAKSIWSHQSSCIWKICSPCQGPNTLWPTWSPSTTLWTWGPAHQRHVLPVHWLNSRQDPDRPVEQWGLCGGLSGETSSTSLTWTWTQPVWWCMGTHCLLSPCSWSGAPLLRPTMLWWSPAACTPAIGTMAWQRTDLMGCSMLLSFDMMPDNKNSIAYLSLRCLGTVKASQRFAKPPLAITTLTAYVLYDTCWWSTGTAWWPLTTSQNSNQGLFSISYLEAQVTCFLFLFFLPPRHLVFYLHSKCPGNQVTWRNPKWLRLLT